MLLCHRIESYVSPDSLPTNPVRVGSLVDGSDEHTYDENIMATVAEITTAAQLFREPGLGRCELLSGFQIAVRKIFPA
jgi:hypothetical protein